MPLHNQLSLLFLLRFYRWYEDNSEVIWSAADRPSLEDAILHAKGMRSKQETREYFKAYRQAKRGCQEGAQDPDMDCHGTRPTGQDATGTGSPGGAEAERPRPTNKHARAKSSSPQKDAAGKKRGKTDGYSDSHDDANTDARGDGTSCNDGVSKDLHVPPLITAAQGEAEAAPKPAPQGSATAADPCGASDRAHAPRQQPQRAARSAALAALTGTAAAGQGKPAAVTSGKCLAREAVHSLDGCLLRGAAQAQLDPAASGGSAASAPQAPAAASSLPIASDGGGTGKTLPPAATCQQTAPQSPCRPESAVLAATGAGEPSPLGALDLNLGVCRRRSNNNAGPTISGASGTENVPVNIHRREVSVGSGSHRHGGGPGEQHQLIGNVLGLRMPTQQHGGSTHVQPDCVKPHNPRPPLYPRVVQQQEERDAAVLQLQSATTTAQVSANGVYLLSAGAAAALPGTEAVARDEGSAAQHQPRAVLGMAPANRAEQSLKPAPSGSEQRASQVFRDICSIPMELLLAQQGSSSQGSAYSLGASSSCPTGQTLISAGITNRSASMGSSAGSCSAHSDAHGVRRSSVGTSSNSGSRPVASWGLMPGGGFDPIAKQAAAYGGYGPSSGYPPYGANLYGMYGTDWYGIGAPGCPAYYQYSAMPAPEQPSGPWNMPYYYATPLGPPAVAHDFLGAALPHQPSGQAGWQQYAQGQYGTHGCQLAAMGDGPIRSSAALAGVRVPAAPASTSTAAVSSRAPAPAPQQQQRAPAQAPVITFPNAYCRLPHREYEAFQDEQMDSDYEAFLSQLSGGETLAMTPEPDIYPDLERELFADAPNAPEPSQWSVGGKQAVATNTAWSPSGGMDDCNASDADVKAAWAKILAEDGAQEDIHLAAEFDQYLMRDWSVSVPQPQR
ncbi:hypothetical protein PLESTM_001339000 [Pleodorina starrii]|nr:hypothetical protein PLESTM_001339000 [Pleodorina starrii]